MNWKPDWGPVGADLGADLGVGLGEDFGAFWGLLFKSTARLSLGGVWFALAGTVSCMPAEAGAMGALIGAPNNAAIKEN